MTPKLKAQSLKSSWKFLSNPTRKYKSNKNYLQNRKSRKITKSLCTPIELFNFYYFVGAT